MSITIVDSEGNRAKVAGLGLPGPAGKSAYQFAVDGGFSGTEEEFAALLGSRSNPNLLDNWYFGDPINQRGQTEYTGVGYTIDRWRVHAGVVTTQLENGFIRFSNNNDYAAYIIQPRENGLDIGRTYTASMFYRSYSGGLFAYQGDAPGYNKNFFYPQADNFALYNAAFTVDYTLDKFVVEIPAHGFIDIAALKLELGPVQTLAHKEGDTWVLNDPPPNKAMELAKCQRYFISVPGDSAAYTLIGHGKSTNNNQLDLQISTPTTMRTQPTVQMSGQWIAIGGGQAIAFSIVDKTVLVSSCGAAEVGIVIQGFTDLIPNQIYTIQRNNDGTGQIILDANL